jgi:hypothetical protein
LKSMKNIRNCFFRTNSLHKPNITALSKPTLREVVRNKIDVPVSSIRTRPVSFNSNTVESFIMNESFGNLSSMTVELLAPNENNDVRVSCHVCTCEHGA